jgi:hypothetical protein
MKAIAVLALAVSLCMPAPFADAKEKLTKQRRAELGRTYTAECVDEKTKSRDFKGVLPSILKRLCSCAMNATIKEWDAHPTGDVPDSRINAIADACWDKLGKQAGK